MRAMILEQSAPVEGSPLRVKELAEPEPGRGQVRVRVSCCAICRTDLHVIEGDLPAATRPIVPGHQVVGRVDRLGEGCHLLKLGDRVGVAWLGGTCGACRWCESGRENLCEGARFTGYHLQGGYAEYVVADERFAYELGEGGDDARVAPLLCAGIIGYRALTRANPFGGCRLGLVGFGSSAHIVMQITRHRGYEVYVATRGKSHGRLAMELGARWAGERVEEIPVRLDSAILFAPVGSLVPPLLEKLDRGGTLAVAGIHLTDVPGLGYQRHLFFERDLRSVTCNTREDGRGLLREAREAGIEPRVREYGLEEANRALQDLKGDRIDGTGVLRV